MLTAEQKELIEDAVECALEGVHEQGFISDYPTVDELKENSYEILEFADIDGRELNAEEEEYAEEYLLTLAE